MHYTNWAGGNMCALDSGNHTADVDKVTCPHCLALIKHVTNNGGIIAEREVIE